MEASDDIKRHFDVVAAGLSNQVLAIDEKFDRTTEELKRHFDGRLSTEIRAIDEKIDRRSEELQRHFEVLGESLRAEIRLVAEGVAGLDEKFTREFVTVREEIREQVGDVKGLLRASYADLDRRLGSS